MKKIIMILMLLFVLYSCENDRYGYGVHLTTTGWVIILAIPVIVAVFFISVIISAIFGDAEQENAKAKKRYGLNPEDKPVKIGKYVGGHPKMNEQIEYCSWFGRDGELIFCKNEFRFSLLGKPVMKIPINAVRNVILEDSSTMDRRVTLGRVLLVGIFALAWRKNKKNEMAFVVIEWKDDRFEHSTMFAYEGKGATQKANNDRNELIAAIR